MKVTIYNHKLIPGMINHLYTIKSKCYEEYNEIELMPNSIESYFKRKGSICLCGKDKYDGLFCITTKSGHIYNIKENPENNNTTLED